MGCIQSNVTIASYKQKRSIETQTEMIPETRTRSTANQTTPKRCSTFKLPPIFSKGRRYSGNTVSTVSTGKFGVSSSAVSRRTEFEAPIIYPVTSLFKLDEEQEEDVISPIKKRGRELQEISKNSSYMNSSILQMLEIDSPEDFKGYKFITPIKKENQIQSIGKVKALSSRNINLNFAARRGSQTFRVPQPRKLEKASTLIQVSKKKILLQKAERVPSTRNIMQMK